MKSFLFALILSMVVFGGGTKAEAYGVLDETVVRLDASRVLYVMTYEFGFLNAETYMPMTAVREGRGGDASSTPIYALVKEDGTIFEEGIARAVVVSNTEARKDEYHAPYGKKAFFTFLALVDMPKEEGETVHLEVNSIPLTIVRKGGERELLLFEKDKLPNFNTSGISL